MSRSGGVGRGTASGWAARADQYAPSGPRLLAMAFGVVLAGSYLQVFYHVADVTGGVRWLALGVGAALVLATAAGSLADARTGAVVGGLLLAIGVAAYVVLVPSIHDELFTVTFVRRWLRYLTGLSVLGFRRADVWAAVVAPGPAFLSWLFLLRRRYDAAATVGGLMLGFFTLTGDAGGTTTLVGMTGLLGLLGAGAVERRAGAWREVTRVGVVVALAALVARSIRIVPDAGALASGGSGGTADAIGYSLGGDLDNAGERARIHESISLSPTVLFTVRADRGDYWHVDAYDRYTGSDWIRTGGHGPYGGPLDPPPGEPTRNEQTVRAERRVGTLPAAWKPIRVDDLDPDRVTVTALGGLAFDGPLDAGDRYRVTSATPRRPRSADRGGDDRAAYPDEVLDRYLQVPESTSERVGRLARSIAADAVAETPDEVAAAIRRWLATNRTYDVDVGVGGDGPPDDVVEDFLFSTDRGYCVYFASAMAVMLRTMDVPARFVLGYATGQSVGEGRWVVRGFDSHAWVEVYRPGAGWTRYDPTPANARVVVRRSILASARQRGADGVDTNASRRAWAAAGAARFGAAGEGPVVGNRSPTGGNLTAGGQLPNAADGGEALGEATSAPSPGRVRNDPVARWLADRDRLDLLTGAVGLALGLHWTGAIDRGYRSVRLRWQRSTDSPARDVERAYDRLEILLAGRFRPRRPDETRRRYVDLAEGIVDADRARRVVDLYERASYAGVVDRSEADEAIRLVDELVDGGDGGNGRGADGGGDDGDA